MGELNTGRLAVSGDDGHGELGPGGLGELGGGGQEELDLGAAMEGARPRRLGGAATARTSSAPAAWRSSTLARPWGELDPGRHGGAQPRPAAAPRLEVGGDDGHGELGPGGLGELDLGADMGELDPGAMGELNPGGLGERRRRGRATAAAAARTSGSGTSGGANERRQRRLLFFPLSVKGTVGTEDGSRRERAIFGLPTPSDPKWVFSLGALLKAHFFPKFTMHNPYMGLGLMIDGLLEIVLGEHFCTPSPNLRI